MPRADVPYPSREICSLKCQIDALQRQINELMKSVNGVQGDGQGNVSLVSGDPAVVINNDAAQHEVEISLDQSQLPAAAVQSVNGQTGVVQLEADDIASDGNSDVQTDIDTLKNLGVTLQGAINGEITARGNADAALQGNINTLQASIPGEAANAVANDPTVTQLATDVPNKLDKITSGSSLKAYTHVGAVQGEKAVADGVDADSIGIRDANGRMHAADPASGATDKTLVTANWVSQTGDNGPNNLLHRSGTETKIGLLNLPAGFYGIRRYYIINNDNTADNIWRKAFEVTMANGRTLEIEVSCHFNNTDVQNARVKIVRTGTNTVACVVIHSEGSTAPMASASNYVATIDNGVISFYVYKRRRYTTLIATTDIYTNYGGFAQLPDITYTNSPSNDPSTETHDYVSVGTIIPYRNEA